MANEKLAPHSVEAEQALLGSIIINSLIYKEVAAKVKTADFFLLKSRHIFHAMGTLVARADTIDVVTLANELQSQGHLEPIGGPEFLLQLTNDLPTWAHYETYTEIVERAAVRRRLLTAASKIANLAIQEDAEILDVLTSADQALMEAKQRNGNEHITTLYGEANTYFDKLEAGNLSSGIRTGMHDLDQRLGDLDPSSVYIVAARPGIGKSALLMNMALYQALHGKSVGVLSLEMSKEQLAIRSMAALASIDSKRIKDGNLSDTETQRYMEALTRIQKISLFLDETPGIKPSALRSKMQQIKREYGLDVLYLDYLQLMRPDKKAQNREAEVSEISQALKDYAKEFHVPVIAAAQLNRRSETRANQEPQLSDLRESGAIEQNADVVMFIHRPKEGDTFSNKALILISKHRMRGPSSCTLTYQPPFTRFVNYAPDLGGK